MAAAVTVSGLHKRYGRTVAVRDVSFEVAEGEVFGLLGPNGSGKTTTVECLQGLRRADGGRLSLFGLDPQTDRARVRRLVGSQLQDSALPERLKVWEALRLFATISPGGPPWERLMHDWGLDDSRNTAFAALSGGQRQRLLVALALVAGPRLVVLDEMTTGLDPAARRLAWGLVAAVRDAGTTVLLVTHYMDEAQHLCDRIAVLLDGRIVAAGAVPDIVAAQSPGSTVRFTANSGADLRFLSGVAGVKEVQVDGDAVTLTGAGPLVARVGHELVEHGIEPLDLRVELPTLEDAYLSLTGGIGPAEGER